MRYIARTKLAGAVFAGTLAATLQIPAWVAATPALAISCGAAVDDHVQGWDNAQPDEWDFQGWRSNITANNWSYAQCHTVRSIAVYENATNLAELGWRKVDGDGHTHTAFEVWLEDGAYHQEFLGGVYPPDDSTWLYQLQNANANQTWASSIAGTVYTPYMFVPGMYHGDFAVTNSETDWANDSLWAHFDNIKACTQVDPNTCSGNWHNPNSMTKQVEAPGWHWCKISNTETYAKQTC